MADTALSLAREYLLPFLKDAYNMITGLPKDVADMKDDLERIQGFIHKLDAMDADADEDANTPDGVKRRMNELIEISFSMEDLIDEYMISMEQQTRDDSAGCAALCDSAVDFIKTMIPRFQLARKMKYINSRFGEIKESSGIRDDFQIQTSQKHDVPSSSRGIQGVPIWQKRRSEDPFYLEEGEMVGFEEPKKELIRWLVEGREERTAISVVGMGGQGKTTLAKKVFDNKEVIRSFDCRVWITVSESNSIVELLRVMLQKICKAKRIDCPKDISKMDRESLIEKVRMLLRQERYVVLFDDVWDYRFWDAIESAVIDNKMGSRIVTTSRHMKVANSFRTSCFVEIHELKALSFEQSWKLFCQKAFKFVCDGKCPEELKDISSNIVKKCGGLPLALVVIGGLFSCEYKTSVDEWEKFSDNLSLKLKNNKVLADITKILSLSYRYLPLHLKSCFLYFGIYPEDYKIKCKRLIRQWMAEGFARDEEVAKQYLEELINRSLVQVSSLSIDGKVKCCHIHDLTREMILRKFKDLSFCHSAHGKLEWNGICRRLTITTNSSDFSDSIETSHIRSIFAFNVCPEELLRRIAKKYRSLKVLDFEGRIFDDAIPTNIGNLIQLKYLSLRGTWAEKLPTSIVELQNLETLDVRETNVEELPMGICKLKKLQHLMGDCLVLKDDIGGLKSLQTLYTLNVSEEAERVRELGSLTQLSKLGLGEVREEEESTLWSSINKMQNLESLHVTSLSELWFDSPPHRLRKLFLKSTSCEFPGWIPQLHKLVKLTLEFYNLTNDPLNSLKDLPNLLFLCLSHYKGESLHFQEGGFQKLKQLELIDMRELNSLCFDKGALPSLTFLCLDRLRRLEEVPSGIQHFQKLETLKVEFMSRQFHENLAPVEGPVHPAIQHVPFLRNIDTIVIRKPDRMEWPRAGGKGDLEFLLF